MSVLISPLQLAAEEDHSLAAENLIGTSSLAPSYPLTRAPSITPSRVPSFASVAFSRISRFPSVVTSLAPSSGVHAPSHERLPSYDPVRVSISYSVPHHDFLRWADLEASAPAYTANAGPAPPVRKNFDINRANSVPPRCPPPEYKSRRRDVMREWGKKVMKEIKGIGGRKVKRGNA